ncbi:MAG: hypothetical protein FWC73_12720 [Defluviitaleaceae bacterium]|nr:hypothetical protein [Defluviitaleaceae bacterium]
MSDLRGTITNFTKNVTKTSGDLFKTTRLSMNVSSEQTNLKNLYLEIGKKVHEIYQYGGTLGKFFDDKYLELEACERKIAELKEQISQIKGVRECSKCGKSAERTAEFCPKCGIRFGALTGEPEDTPPQPTQQQPADPVPAPIEIAATQQESTPLIKTKNCRVCGMENDISTKFCLSCGRIVD